MSDSNSPIDRVHIQKHSINSKSYFEVLTWLRPNLKCIHTQSSVIYGTCDATGSSEHLQTALWRSFSECIERWAYHDLMRNQSSRFAIDIDKTTTGFAAFPGLFAKSSREKAFLEALERWAISQWWLGNLNIQRLNCSESEPFTQYFRIEIASKSVFIIIAVKKCFLSATPFWAYGFSADNHLAIAKEKSLIELKRNESALRKFLNKKIASDSLNDQRLIYFSSAPGYRSFIAKTQQRVQNPVILSELLVDSEIPGPWSKFTTVWRCLFSNTNYMWHKVDHFMF